MLLHFIRYLLALALILTTTNSFAHQDILRIYIDNQSQGPYTLVIYGTGSSYEITNAFDVLDANKSAVVQINYRSRKHKAKTPEPIYHILLLDSDQRPCRLNYIAHPTHRTHYHFFKTEKFKTEFKSFEGNCKAWKESEDKLHIVLIDGK